MKLLLDEHVPVAIAALLRARGHDAEAVGERMDLRGMTDGQLWMTALAEDRTVVTYDIGGFLALATEELSAGRAHPGVVLCNPRTHPPTRNGVGLVADALEALESGHGSGGLGNSVLWLPVSRG